MRADTSPGDSCISVCGPAANILQEVNVYTLTNKQCGEQKRFDDSTISDSMLCSSTPGRGLFKGDTGGPLVFKVPDISKFMLLP